MTIKITGLQATAQIFLTGGEVKSASLSGWAEKTTSRGIEPIENRACVQQRAFSRSSASRERQTAFALPSVSDRIAFAQHGL
jgi:hypothetical protein